jgi:hypothetical protein
MFSIVTTTLNAIFFAGNMGMFFVFRVAAQIAEPQNPFALISVHIAILEFVVAIFAVGFGLLGFVGYNRVKAYVREQAKKTAKEEVQEYLQQNNAGEIGYGNPRTLQATPDLDEPTAPQKQSDDDK